MSEKIIIVDGDLWAFKCSAASEKRSILVTDKKRNIQKSFKHRREFKDLMKKHNKEITEDYVIEDIQDAEPLEFCLSTIKNKYQNLKEELETDNVVIFCGDSWNFRLDLPLPKKYKSNRSGDVLKPVHLSESKKYIKNVLKAKESVGYETDDSLCITAYDELSKGNQPIIHTIDKDAYSHNGVWLHNPDKDELILIPELGDIYIDKNNQVKGKGMKFFCAQWLYGDRADGYVPYELSDLSFGAKAVYNLLSDVPDVTSCLKKVIEQFKIFYPKKFEYLDWNNELHEASWKNMLELYYACAWMKRSKTDDSLPHSLFDKYKVKYK